MSLSGVYISLGVVLRGEDERREHLMLSVDCRRALVVVCFDRINILIALFCLDVG